MKPVNNLLTIGLPTYNRAEKLDRQLYWLAHEIAASEAHCEIIISDNCSTDNTQEIIQKWQPFFSKATLKLNRNSENLGAVRNIAYCINTASSKYVWTISDDDPIEKQTLAYVLQNLSEHPDLSLLVLNFSKRDVRTGHLVYERCFNVTHETSKSKGKAIFGQCLAERLGGGVALTTAVVYRTNLAQQAIQKWSDGLANNLLVQIYWSGYCAFHGSVKVTQGIYLECTAGNHHFSHKKELYLKLKYVDLPEVFLRLIELGYSPELGQTLAIKLIKNFNLKEILRMLRYLPKTVLSAIPIYLNLLSKSQKSYNSQQKFKLLLDKI